MLVREQAQLSKDDIASRGYLPLHLYSISTTKTQFLSIARINIPDLEIRHTTYNLNK
jgi:hypothetical protein